MKLEERFKKLVACLATIQEESGECGCTAASVELDCLAEQAVQGVDIHTILPKVAAHLDCCPDCREEYDALVAIVRAEHEDMMG